MGRTLGPRAAWTAAGVLFLVLYVVNLQLYVPADALSVSIGGIIGVYCIAWLIYRVLRWRMGTNAPEARYAILIIACIGLFAHVWQRVSLAVP